MVAKWLRHRVIVKLDRSSGVMGSRWWLMVSNRVIEHHFDDRRSAGYGSVDGCFGDFFSDYGGICGWPVWVRLLRTVGFWQWLVGRWRLVIVAVAV